MDSNCTVIVAFGGWPSGHDRSCRAPTCHTCTTRVQGKALGRQRVRWVRPRKHKNQATPERLRAACVRECGERVADSRTMHTTHCTTPSALRFTRPGPACTVAEDPLAPEQVRGLHSCEFTRRQTVLQCGGARAMPKRDVDHAQGCLTLSCTVLLPGGRARSQGVNALCRGRRHGGKRCGPVAALSVLLDGCKQIGAALRCTPGV